MRINYKNKQNCIDIDAIDYDYHYIVGFNGEYPYVIKRNGKKNEYWWESMASNCQFPIEHHITDLVELEYLEENNIDNVEVFKTLQDLFEYVHDYICDYNSSDD